MDFQYRELQEMVNNRNEITTTALICATLILNCAHGLKPSQQRPMLELVKTLITIEPKEFNFFATINHS